MLAGWTLDAGAQQACKAEVSVGVIDSNGNSFRGLAREDFLTRGPKGIGVESIAYDEGPRRLLLVVDTSKKLSIAAHKAEIELVKAIVATSRPADSLALITARGPGGTVKFGEDRSKLLDVLESEANPNKDRGPLDAANEGLEWFSDPRPGDAILLIAASTDGNHKTNAKSLAKALASHHVRLFGLALGLVMTRNISAEGVVTSTTSQGMAYVTAGLGDYAYDTGDPDFYPLTTNSGGIVVAVMNPESQHGSYKPEDPRFQQFLKSRAMIVSNAVQAFYRFQIDQPKLSHPEVWSLDIKEAIRKHSPAMFLLYSHELGPC